MTSATHPAFHPVLRPATREDGAFLLAVYCTTRAAELAPLPWSAALKNAFCEQQFCTRAAAYANTYPRATHMIVCAPDGEAAGQYLTSRTRDALLLVDISFLPRYRGAGWGTSLIRSLQEEAAAGGLAMRLSVTKDNPALALYRRLGFAITGGDEIRHEMTWQPGSTRQLEQGEFDGRTVSR